jgi:hypothetical protein
MRSPRDPQPKGEMMPEDQATLDLAGNATEPVRRPILGLDFDGVLHSYASGWQGAAKIPDPPVCGFAQFLERAVESFDVCVFSSRSTFSEGRIAMRRWLETELVKHYRQEMLIIEADRRASRLVNRIGFPADKPAAFVWLDDRAVTFTGEWPDPGELAHFRPWWDVGHHT